MENRVTGRAKSMKKIMVRYTAFFGVSLGVLSALAIVLSILSILKVNETIILVATIIWFALFVALAVIMIISVMKIYRLNYNGMYVVTRNIVDDLSDNKKKFDRYPEQLAAEFKEMNRKVEYLENHLSSSVVFSENIDYSSISLHYSSDKLRIIDNGSFAKNIPEIIMLSQAYRNAFIYITYDDPLDQLIGQSRADIVGKIRDVFKYDNILIADAQDDSGYYVYIPRLDSMSRLKEEIELFLTGSSMVKNAPNGKVIVLAKASVVIYPFSDIDDILSDLRYAARQGESINIYLPDRLNKINNTTILHGSLSLNKANQLVTNLAAMKLYDTNKTETKKTIRKQLKAFAAYINADFAGVIVRDDNIDKIVNYIAINNIDEEFLKEDDFVSQDFLDIPARVADPDGTYFFSSRAHLNVELGNLLDKFNIYSGHLYILSDDNGPLGLIYFFRRNMEMNLDSYLRESAFSMSYQIGSAIRETSRNARLFAAEERSDLIMKLSDYMLYGVDKTNFEIKYASSTFKDAFGKCVGETCYKTMFGLEKPCQNCPLLSKKKRIADINERKYEASIALLEPKQNVVRMLLKPVEEDAIEHNRFDTDFLINSYYSLYQDLKNIYLAQGRGYVLLLTIENYMNLFEKYGNEGYVRYIREFTKALNERVGHKEKYYVYNNYTIAIVAVDFLRTEIIDLSEKIYQVSKMPFIELNNQKFEPLRLNYIAVKYPQEYSSHVDLLRHCQRVIDSYDHTQHIDQIYFEGNDYFRSASRREFINEVIDTSFKEGTFKVKLQPMINTGSKKITGAELLIRLSDDYRSQAIGAEEVIKVAGEEKKIGIISNALINYVGELYQKQGNAVFKPKGFNRLSINTDYSFFADENFVKDTQKLMKKYGFPNNFLSFEINENDLADHFDFFKTNIPKIKSLGVYFTADQYTGKYLSIEKIKILGLNEIKVPRNIVRDIDTNKANFAQVKELISSAEHIGIKASLVGIENKDQYFMVRDLSKNVEMQGYYFYAPIDAPEVIEALKIGQ